MACEVLIVIVLPGEPAAKLKAIFTTLNATEVCYTPNNIRVFYVGVLLEVLTVLEC